METSENSNKKKLFCRLCVAHEGKYTITPLKNHIKFCYNIQVQSNDGLSQVVCGQCRTIVREFSKLKQLYQARQSFLRRKRRISIIKAKQATPSCATQNATEAPVAAVEPAISVEPAAAVETATNVQPTTNVEPATIVQPPEEVQPPAEVQPTTNVQPTTKPQPDEKVQPTVQVQPTAPVLPAAIEQPSLPEEFPPILVKEEIPDEVTKCASPSTTDDIVIKCTLPSTTDDIVINYMPPSTTDDIVINCMPPSTTDDIVINCMPPSTTDDIVINCMPPSTTDDIVINCMPALTTDDIVINCMSPSTTDDIVINCSPSTTDDIVINCMPPSTTDDIVINYMPPSTTDDIVIECTPPSTTDDTVIKCMPPSATDDIMNPQTTDDIVIKEVESQPKKQMPIQKKTSKLFEKYYNCKFCRRSFKNSQRFNMHLADHRKMVNTKDKLIQAECFIAMAKLPEAVPVPDDDFVRISESKRVCKRLNPTYFVTFEVRSNKGKKMCINNKPDLNILDAWNASIPFGDAAKCDSNDTDAIKDDQKGKENIIQYPLLEYHIGCGKTIQSIIIDSFHKNEIETLAKLDDTKYRGLFLKNGRKISMAYSSWTLPLLRFFEYRHLYINWIDFSKKLKAQKKTCIKVSRRMEEEVVVDNLTNFVPLDKATNDIMDNQLTEAELELTLDRETILKFQESVSSSIKASSFDTRLLVASTVPSTVNTPKPTGDGIVGIKIKNASILLAPMQKVHGANSPGAAKVVVKAAANKSNSISVIRLHSRENNYQNVSKSVYTTPSTIKCVQEERLLNNPQLVNVEPSYIRIQPNKVSPMQKAVQNIPASYYQNVSALPVSVASATTTNRNNNMRSESHLQNYMHYHKEKQRANYQSVPTSNKIEQKPQLIFHNKTVPHHGLPEKFVHSAHTNIVPIKRIANTAVPSKYNQYAINSMQSSQFNPSYNPAVAYHHSPQNLRNDQQNQMSQVVLASGMPMQTISSERGVQIKGMTLYQGNDMNTLQNNAYNAQVHNSSMNMLNINSQSMVPSFNNNNLYDNIPQAAPRIVTQGQMSTVPVITNKVMFTGETGHSNVGAYYYQNGNETVTNDNILYNNYPTNYEYG